MAKKKSVIKDWINRDDDYVYRGEIRSGWDDDYDSTSDYVLNGFLKPDTSEGEVREIQKLCANRANILADGKPIVFTINAEERTAKTDGKKVTVGTAVLDDPTKSFSDKADIMMGLTTHEMAHVLHSVFSHLKNVETPLHKSILNVLEDERIEHILCDEFPGYASNLSKVKQYFLDEKYLIEDKLEEGKVTDEEKHAMELFDLFFKIVRYPKHIDVDKMSQYEMEIDEIKSILTPYPMTPKAVFEASKEVYKVINKSLSKKVKDELFPEEPKKGKPVPADGGDSSGEALGGEPESGDGPADAEVESSDRVEDVVKSVADKIEEKIAEMMKDLDSDNDASKRVEVSDSVKNIDFNTEYIYDAEAQATFRTGAGNKTYYERYLSDVRSDSRRLANSLFVRTFSEDSYLRGLRSGYLDESKLVEAIHGVNTVHLQKTTKQTTKINIVLLIDESGSMGYGEGDSTRYAQAARAAILIEQAFNTFPAGELFIYGFTGDCYHVDTYDYNQILRYREPGLKVPYSLGSLKGRAQNRDGHCIRAVARRVRQFTNEPMLFFIISDGQPHSSDYSGDEAMLDTRNAVKEVSKMKFFPVQIGIGAGIKPEEQKMMFDDFVNYKDPKSMVDDLRKLIIRKSHKIFGI